MQKYSRYYSTEVFKVNLDTRLLVCRLIFQQNNCTCLSLGAPFGTVIAMPASGYLAQVSIQILQRLKYELNVLSPDIEDRLSPK